MVLAALLLGVLVAAGALAMDVGRAQLERRVLAKAADAAALAAVQRLPQDPEGARQEALRYISLNAPGRAGDVRVSPDGTSITVTVASPSFRLYLGAVLGRSSLGLRREATAAVRSVVEADSVMPWGLREGARRNATYGSVVVLKYDSQNAASGDFGALRIGGSGASVYRDNIVRGGRVRLGTTYAVEPGNMVGPTREGLQRRLGATDPACDTFDEVFEQDVTAGTWRFRSPRCNPWSGQGQGSTRVVLVPVVDDPSGGGSGQVTPRGFALVFLEGLGSCTGSSCEVRARFVVAAGDVRAILGPYKPGVDLVARGLVQ
jgi:Flp pilus assembly protein TadG